MEIKRFLSAALIITTLFLSSGCQSPSKDVQDGDEDWQIQQDIMNANRDKDQWLRDQISKNNYDFSNPLVELNPFDVSPLTGVIAFQTDTAKSVTVTIPGDTTYDTIIYQLPARKVHVIPIIGLYPDRTNTVTLTLSENGGVSEERNFDFVTPSLPDSYANAVDVVMDDAVPTPGLTLVSGGNMRNPYMFDSSGVIRWYLDVESDAHGYFPASNGRFFLIAGYAMVQTETRDYARFVFDMDYLGRLHQVYDFPKGIHHEIIEKEEDGNLLILGNSLESHVEDTIAEVDRQTGEIVKEINFADYIGDTAYNERYDWAHINSLSYDSQEGTMILSPRDVSSVVKIDWEKQEILWILADPQIWKGTAYEPLVLEPEGETYWHYEQHAAFPIPQDIDQNPDTLDLMLFDNRIIRNETNPVQIKGDPDHSSVTQYAINEGEATVKQLRRFPNGHAIITSNFNLFYEEDRLIANHGSLRPTPDSAFDTMWGEIYEYRYSTGELLRAYKLRYGFYRAHRITVDANASSLPVE